MSTPRRQIVRPSAGKGATHLERERRVEKLRCRLERERQSLTSWKTRFKRAYTTVQKHQEQVIRLERKIAKLEEQLS